MYLGIRCDLEVEIHSENGKLRRNIVETALVSLKRFQFVLVFCSTTDSKRLKLN